MICQDDGTEKSTEEKASSADRVNTNNYSENKTPYHESGGDLEDENENPWIFTKCGEAMCDPRSLEFGTNNVDEEYNARNLEDSPSIEGLHTEGELPLPPWGTKVSENDIRQWTGLALSENSRNRRFSIAENKMILSPWGTNILNCGDGPWKDVNPGNMSKCGFFLSHVK